MSDGTSDLTPRQAARRRNPEVSRRIGANIRRARQGLGLSQGQLARLVDEWTDSNSVSRWERGKARPLERTLERLAEVLEVPGADPQWFYATHDDEPEEAVA